MNQTALHIVFWKVRSGKDMSRHSLTFGRALKRISWEWSPLLCFRLSCYLLWLSPLMIQDLAVFVTAFWADSMDVRWEPCSMCRSVKFWSHERQCWPRALRAFSPWVSHSCPTGPASLPKCRSSISVFFLKTNQNTTREGKPLLSLWMILSFPARGLLMCLFYIQAGVEQVTESFD